MFDNLKNLNLVSDLRLSIALCQHEFADLQGTEFDSYLTECEGVLGVDRFQIRRVFSDAVFEDLSSYGKEDMPLAPDCAVTVGMLRNAYIAFTSERAIGARRKSIEPADLPKLLESAFTSEINVGIVESLLDNSVLCLVPFGPYNVSLICKIAVGSEFILNSNLLVRNQDDLMLANLNYRSLFLDTYGSAVVTEKEAIAQLNRYADYWLRTTRFLQRYAKEQRLAEIA